MIEKVPEAKEIMNALFLQVQSKGDHLRTGDVYGIIKHARTSADKKEASIKARLANIKKDCDTDLKNWGSRLVENQKWQFTIGRHVENNNRAIKRLQNFLDRAGVEKDDYNGLMNIINAGWTKWKAFQKAAIKGQDHVISILRKAKNSLREIDGNALVELSSTHKFFSDVTEMKNDFESNLVELEGLRPVISKLLQLMSKSSAVNKQEVRRKLRGLFKKIIRQVRNMRDDFSAVAERQDAIFGAIIESYKENLLRIGKLLDRLKKDMNGLTKKKAALADSNKNSVNITAMAKGVFTTRKNQCIAYAERVARISVGIQKVRNIVAQIAEILTERFGAIKSYFIQRDSKELEKETDILA